MRIILLIAVIVLMVGFLGAAQAERPSIILYTAYRQVGWGDAVQIGAIDIDGGLWTARGYDSELKWPYGWENQIAYLQTSDFLTEAGKLTNDDLFALKSLVCSVSAPEGKPSGWMCDAGTESSYALRYDREGNAEAILLGMTGDDFLENTDPNAQALYLKLRLLFPFVRCYAGEISESWGFQPVPLAAFCGLEGIDWDSVTVSAVYEDCEAGPRELEVTESEAKRVIGLMKNGVVTGKENALCVTGGTKALFFTNRDGKAVGSITLYNGLLVRNDGMYSVQNILP